MRLFNLHRHPRQSLQQACARWAITSAAPAPDRGPPPPHPATGRETADRGQANTMRRISSSPAGPAACASSGTAAARSSASSFPGDAIGLHPRPEAVCQHRNRRADPDAHRRGARDRRRLAPARACARPCRRARRLPPPRTSSSRSDRSCASAVRTPTKRVAHLFMELDYRLEHARPYQPTTASRCRSPRKPSPTPLASAWCTSTAPCSRCAAKAASNSAHGRLAILDRAALTSAGEFTPPVLTPRAPTAGLHTAGTAHPV